MNSYKLEELLNLKRGYDLTKNEMIHGDIPVVGSNGIIGYHNKYNANKPCLTIGRSGTVGIPHYYEKDCWIHNTSLYIDDFKGNNPRYLFYLLKILNLNNIATSTGVPTLNRNFVHPIKILATTDIIEQNKIVSVLNCIDQKIQNNNKIIKELEDMAKTLYDYWFVQFDFLDENGNPYKTSGGKMVYNEELKREIPLGWKCKLLGELCTFKNGINYEKNEIGDKGYKIINVRNITATTLLLNVDDLDYICLNQNQADKYICNENDILIARSGTPGATRLLKGLYCDVIFCGFIISAKPYNTDNQLYITYILKSLENTSATKTGGSILQNVSQDTLKAVKIVMPDNNVINCFNDKINPLLDRVQNLIEENQQLTSLRDWLLPMLMNGQATVE